MENVMREILAALMAKHGDNPTTLSRKSSVGQSTIFRFMNGEVQDLRPDTAKKIAEAYGITESELRGDIPIENEDIEIETRTYKTNDPAKKEIIDRLMAISDFDDLAYIRKTIEILEHLATDKRERMYNRRKEDQQEPERKKYYYRKT